MIEPKTDTELTDQASLRYESLRFQVLGKNEALRKGSLGLTLFIRQGMLAWINAWPKCAVAGSSPGEQSNSPSILPYKIKSEVTKILANITLCNLGGSGA